MQCFGSAASCNMFPTMSHRIQEITHASYFSTPRYCCLLRFHQSRISTSYQQLSTVFSSRLQSLESILPQRTRVSAMLRCAFWRPAAQSHGRIESFGTQECAALRLPACCQSSDHKTYYYLCATALSCCYIVSLHTYKSKHISYVYVFVCMHARKPQKREWS